MIRSVATGAHDSTCIYKAASIVTRLKKVLAIVSFAFGVLSSPGLSKADPVGPFPLSTGTLLPFPWESVEGIWRVEWDNGEQATHLAIEVKLSAEGVRTVEILAFDGETFIADAAGRGFEIQQGKMISAVLLGSGPAMVLHMWQIESQNSPKKDLAREGDPAAPRVQMKVAIEGVDGIEPGRPQAVSTGTAERISSETFEQLAKRKCAIGRVNRENPRDSSSSCR